MPNADAATTLVAATRHAARLTGSAEIYGVPCHTIRESADTVRVTAVAENGDHLIVRITESRGNPSGRATATTHAVVTTDADRTERPIKTVSVVLWLQNHRKGAL
jgi:branched-subunit amino acid aminotransferase/4-amino-4-deoxychorismate lyase